MNSKTFYDWFSATEYNELRQKLLDAGFSPCEERLKPRYDKAPIRCDVEIIEEEV